MPERLIQLPLHPLFPQSRVVATPRKIDLANPALPVSTKDDESVPPLTADHELVTGFGSLIAAENADGNVEWLNYDSTSSLLNEVNALFAVVFVIPAGPAQPSLAVLRFLVGEVIPYLLGVYEPSTREKAVVAEPSGNPGNGSQPRKILTRREALLYTLWDSPTLEAELANVLQISSFNNTTYNQLLGYPVDPDSIKNYKKNYLKEQYQTLQFGYEEIDSGP